MTRTDPTPDAPGPITGGEWDILETLWTLERATARRAAEHLAPTRGWAYSTVKTMLDRMAAKGLVNARRVGNVWEYTPAVDPARARRAAWKRFVATAFGGAVAPALSFLADDGTLTPKQRGALLRALEKRSAGK